MKVLASDDAIALRGMAGFAAAIRASRHSFTAPHVDELLAELGELAMRAATYVDAEDFWESQIFLGGSQ